MKATESALPPATPIAGGAVAENPMRGSRITINLQSKNARETPVRMEGGR